MFFSVCNLISTGCRIVFPVASGVCPLVGDAGLRGLCRLPGRRDWCLPVGRWSWVLSLWLAGPCQGVDLVGSCGLRKIFGSLSADRWGCVPALLVVQPAVSQHWSLQAFWWGKVLVRKWWPPGALLPMSSPQNHCHQCLHPHSEPLLPPTLPRDPPRPAGSSDLGSFFFFFLNKLIYLFLAVLGLCCCAWAFSSCGEWRLLFVAVCGLLVAVVSLVAEHRLYACGL